METYLWKSIVCSAILTGIYFLVFEKQKNHRFKRFYLLASLAFSLLIPLASISYGVQYITTDGFVVESYGISGSNFIENPTGFTFKNALIALYLLISIFLLKRFCLNLMKLIRETRSGEKIPFGKHFLILKNHRIHPYSFWNFIFLNKNDFENQRIDEKILIHEQAHLEQKHSIDVLFIEILLIVFWFNPAFYFYRKAIITNHEFLADEAVLEQENHISDYQKLLLNELISERILFTQPFNLSNTKKRIKMMTTPKNRTGKYLSWITVPLSAGLFFAFAEKIPAQIENKNNFELKESTAQKSMENKITEANHNAEQAKIIVKDDIAIPVDPKNMTAEETEIFNKFKNMAEQPDQIIDLRKTSDTLKVPKKETSPAKTTNHDDPKNEVDQLPEFPGGMGAFRNKIASVFNTAIFDGTEGLVKSEASYIIDEEGDLKMIITSGDNEKFNNELARTLMKVGSETKWRPAMKDGKPVRYRMRLPMTMNFQ